MDTPDPTPDQQPAGRPRRHAWGTATEPVVADLSTEVPDGQITVIVGANACGKSTLLRGMARLLRPTSRRGAARRAGDRDAALAAGGAHPRPAAAEPGHPRGRHASSTWSAVAGTRTRAPSGAGRARTSAAVAEALELTDTLDLADRLVDELSGGQRQRVWIAMALAQQTDLLLLDEPTTYLDVAHQVEVLDLLADLNQARGTTIVMVLHDLNLAARYADHLVAMREGGIVADGPPAEVITEDCVREVFGMECRVIEDPVTAHPAGDPAGSPLPQPCTTGGPHDHDHETVPAQRADHRGDGALRHAAQPRLRPGRARQPGLRRPRRGRVRHPVQGGAARPDRRAAADPGRRRGLLRRLAGRPRRAAVARCAPTRSATSSATATRCGWWSTSWCTRTTGTASDRPAAGRCPRSPGDVIQVIAPHRLSSYGGTEFDPAGRPHLLLIGDETAVPAISPDPRRPRPRPHGRGVPRGAHARRTSSTCPRPRASRCGGSRATTRRTAGGSCRRYAATSACRRRRSSRRCPSSARLTSDLDIDVWETPRYSSAGEDLEAAAAHPLARPRPRRHLRLDRRGVLDGQGAAPHAWSPSSASTAPRSPSWATGARAWR